MRINRIWFDRPGVHWGRAIVIATVATVGVALWIGDERGLWDEAPTAASEVASVAAPASSAAPRRAPPVAAPAVVVQASTRAPSEAPPVATEVRVCGLGGVAVGPDGPDVAARRLRAERTRPVMARWIEALQASAEPRAKAAALVLAPVLAAPPVAVARTACGADAECAPPTSLAGVVAWASQRERLAEMALASRDAGVLGIAMQACATGTPPAEGSACLRLEPEDGIAADPAHAEPWLRLADKQQERADAELADEAFRRALSLPFGRLAEQSLLGAVQATQPADAGVQEKLQMGEALAALRSGWREPGGSAASASCSPAQLKLPGRRELCLQLAEHLVLRGATLQDVASGRALGRRLGWYPERMAAAAKDLEAAARLAAAFSGDEAHDCPAAQRQIDYYAAVAAQGELAAVRRFAASLPKP
jgi:hypothetical protein